MNGNAAKRSSPSPLATVNLLLTAAALTLAAPAAAGGAEQLQHTVGPDKRPYQVLLPPGEVSPFARAPLVLYLHPSGDPQIGRFKNDYWPMLRRRKCIVAIPLSGSKRMWLAQEKAYILAVLADVVKHYSVQAKRIVLMGVSGGGQVALMLADRQPDRFRAVIALSTRPVVARGRRARWFYPSRKVLKTCPYLVANNIRAGSALMYWRQVRAKCQPAGASISILPVIVKAPAGKKGQVDHWLGKIPQLAAWLDAVLAGKHPPPLGDPQKLAMAGKLAPVAAGLSRLIEKAGPLPAAETLVKHGQVWQLSVPLPKDFRRSVKEAVKDADGAPLTQIRIEHKQWFLYVRCEACSTARPMAEVLAAEQDATIRRGLMYQVYETTKVALAGRTWHVKIGSTAYPDRTRGWVWTFFLHVAAHVDKNPTQWLTVMVYDQTGRPDAGEMARLFRTIAGKISVHGKNQLCETASRAAGPAGLPFRSSEKQAARPLPAALRTKSRVKKYQGKSQ